MSKKSTTKWAVHKAGTESFGYLCSFKDEAEHMLGDLHRDVYNMPKEELDKYHVVEVTLSWDE